STLPTTGTSFRTGNGGRVGEAFAAGTQTGTLYASLLIQGNGNSGDVMNGVIIGGTNANLFAGFGQGNSASNTGFGLGTVANTGYDNLKTNYTTAANITNTGTHYVVLELNTTIATNNI